MQGKLVAAVARLTLLTLLLLAPGALASEPHLELGVNLFDAAFTPPDAEVGVSRVYSTSGSFTVFLGKRLGFRLMGGMSWYSALGLGTTDVAAVHAPVVLPSWFGEGGVVWRFEPVGDLIWVDTHLDAGVLNAQLGLSQSLGILAGGSLGSHPATSVGVSMHVRLERHIALHLGLRASLYALGAPRVSGCNEGDLQRIAAAEQQGLDVASAAVSSGCQAGSFHDLPPGSSAVAQGVIQGRGPLVNGNLAVELGFAFF